MSNSQDIGDQSVKQEDHELTRENNSLAHNDNDAPDNTSSNDHPTEQNEESHTYQDALEKEIDRITGFSVTELSESRNHEENGSHDQEQHSTNGYEQDFNLESMTNEDLERHLHQMINETTIKAQQGISALESIEPQDSETVLEEDGSTKQASVESQTPEQEDLQQTQSGHTKSATSADKEAHENAIIEQAEVDKAIAEQIQKMEEQFKRTVEEEHQQQLEKEKEAKAEKDKLTQKDMPYEKVKSESIGAGLKSKPGAKPTAVDESTASTISPPVNESKESQLLPSIPTESTDHSLSSSLSISRESKIPTFSTASTSTTYKGITIPENSALVNIGGSALTAYRNLLSNSGTSFKNSNVANAQLAALPLTLAAPEYLSFNIQLLINTLPVLDNLATQILRIISQGPYQKIMELVSNARESYTSIAFGNLVEIFETTKKIYNSEESPFFTVENVTFGVWKYGAQAPAFLKGKEDTIEGTLRKVNLSTFLLATLGLIDLGFFFLNEAFLDVFCPPQNLDPSYSITNLKTDFLSPDAPKSVGHIKNLNKQNVTQTKFLKSQAILYLELKTQAFISAMDLGDRSKDEIIQDLFPDNLDEILLKRKEPSFDIEKTKIVRKSTMFTPAELDFLARCDSRKENLLKSETDASLMEKYEWIKFLNDLLDYVSKNVGFLVWGPKGKLAQELTRLSDDIRNGTNDDESNKRKLDDPSGPSPGYNGSHQREKKRPNRPSTFRRTWTAEEENALKEGLREKGPQWSAILGMYGAGGSINEHLKNRTTLQLKDKARNWKIYYLKHELDVPEYLSKVTGDSGRHILDSRNKIRRPKTGARVSNLMKQAQQIGGDEVAGGESVEGDAASYEDLLNNLLSGTGEKDGDGDDKNKETGDVSVEATNEFNSLVAEAFK